MTGEELKVKEKEDGKNLVEACGDRLRGTDERNDSRKEKECDRAK